MRKLKDILDLGHKLQARVVQKYIEKPLLVPV